MKARLFFQTDVFLSISLHYFNFYVLCLCVYLCVVCLSVSWYHSIYLGRRSISKWGKKFILYFDYMTFKQNISTMPKLQIGSFNCNGMGGTSKRDLVLNWLKLKDDQIIFVQESHSTSDSENDWRKTWEGDILFNQATAIQTLRGF